MKPCPYCGKSFDERGISSHIKKHEREFEKSENECGSARSEASSRRNSECKSKPAGVFQISNEKHSMQSFHDKHQLHNGHVEFHNMTKGVSEHLGINRQSRGSKSAEGTRSLEENHNDRSGYCKICHCSFKGERGLATHWRQKHPPRPKTASAAIQHEKKILKECVGKVTNTDLVAEKQTPEKMKPSHMVSSGSHTVSGNDKKDHKKEKETSNSRQDEVEKGAYWGFYDEHLKGSGELTSHWSHKHKDVAKTSNNFVVYDQETKSENITTNRISPKGEPTHIVKQEMSDPGLTRSSSRASQSTSAENLAFCGICHRSFKNTRGLTTHWSKMHPDKEKTNTTFVVISSETTHISVRTNSIPPMQDAYEDNKDGEEIRRSCDGGLSASTSHKYEFQCFSCDIGFKTEFDLGIHIGEKHKEHKSDALDSFRFSDVNPLSNTKALSKLEIDMRLPKDEITDASEVLNRFVNGFKDELQSISPNEFNFDELRSGSYYDKTKIGSPDEFDIMFYPTNISVKAEFDDRLPGYCKIRILGKPPPEYDGLVAAGYLNAAKFKERVFGIFSDCIRSPLFRPGRSTTRTPRQQESPAFTVLYKAIPGKPPIDIDLVPSVKIQEWPRVARKINPHWIKREHAKQAMKMFHAVAKSCPHDVPDKELYWRISFSHAEKVLVKFANNGDETSRRKNIFRIMKQLKHNIKEQNPGKIDKFCSYHLKMFMLNQYDTWTKDVKTKDELLQLVILTVKHLTTCLRNSEIRNYFIRSDNILQFVPREELDLVRTTFENYLSK